MILIIAEVETDTASGSEVIVMYDSSEESRDTFLTVTKNLMFDSEGTEFELGDKTGTYYVALYQNSSLTKMIGKPQAITFNGEHASSTTFTGIKKVKGYKMTIAASSVVHIPTKGGNDTIPVDVKVNEARISLGKGETFRLKASEIKEKESKKINHHRGIMFESSDKSVATVKAKGKITARGKGTCSVYAYAQNGVSGKVKVTVK